MKKTNRIIALLMAVFICAGLFAGCAEKPAADTPAPPVSQPADVNLEDVYNQMVGANVLPKMYILEDAYIQSYYGIAPEAISDGIFAVADDTMLADTVIIVRVSAAGSAAEIEGNFSRINQQRLQEMESYNPEQYARAEDAVIKTIGDYVCYIISDNNDSLLGLLEDSIG